MCPDSTNISASAPAARRTSGAFVGKRDKKRPCAGRREAGGDFGCAETVCVGFDDGGGFDLGTRQSIKIVPVA